jgi:peptidoglycan hydrolase-like protein with peptidoglycan-binding domain
MKKIALLPLALLLLCRAAFADDQLRNVQTELKSLGFYYGDVSGQANAETTAALRRYQIRNGLEVTGTLNKETLAALGMGPGKAPATAAAKPAPAPPVAAKKAPPVDLRRAESVEEKDRDFLRREETRRGAPDAVSPLAPNEPPQPRDRSVIDPPAPLEAPSADYPVLFAGTPYANSPPSVQQQMLRRAQTLLANRGYYREAVDGIPGPATEEALLDYQRDQRITLTGRLDVDTINRMRLQAGETNYSKTRPPVRRTFRGIWIDRGGLRFGLEFD